MISLIEILKIFRTNYTPSEREFQETWKSFWHKSEKLPISQIFGLQEEIAKVTTKFKGYYSTLADLQIAYPQILNKKDFYAFVGSPYPGTVWKVKVDGGAWTDTGEVPSQEQIDLTEYAKKTEVEVKADEETEKGKVVRTPDGALTNFISYNYSSIFITPNIGSINNNGKLLFAENTTNYARIGLCVTPNNTETELFEKTYTKAMLKVVSSHKLDLSIGSGIFYNGTERLSVAENQSDGKYIYTAEIEGSINQIFLQTNNGNNYELELEVSADSYIGDLANVANAMTYTDDAIKAVRSDMQSNIYNASSFYLASIVDHGATIVDERTIKFKDTTGYLRIGIQANKAGKGRLVLESDCDFRVINPTAFYYETSNGAFAVDPIYVLGGGSNGKYRLELPEKEDVLKYFMQLHPSERVQDVTMSISPDSYIQDYDKNKSAIEKEITYTEVTVKANGTIGTDCDFTDIKSALDSIVDNDYYKRYLVFVRNGVYDISNESYPFLGMKNYVEIIGDSKNGVTVINRKPTFNSNYAGFDPNYYGDKIKYALLKNMRIISYNGKGPVHIDTNYTQFAEDGVIEVENCTLINENTSPMLHYQTGLACGLLSGQTVIARNVDSNSSLWCHNNYPKYSDKGCRFELYNCRFPFTTIADLYCYGRDKLVMHGCKCDVLTFTLAKHWNEPRDYIRFSWEYDFSGNQFGRIIGELETATGDKNQAFWNAAFGGKFGITDSSVHMYCKNNSTEDIKRGDLITLDTNVTEISIKKWTFGLALYGVSLDDINMGEYGTVQYSGIVEIPISGTLIAGDAVQLSSDGKAIKQTTGNMIGYYLENNLIRLK